MKYEKKPNVSISIYGDGGANQGQIFEAFNMAKLWNLPCIYHCDNNGYGYSTKAERSTAMTDLYKRGDFIPGIRVDGMDILAVREAFIFAKNYALEHGPILVETMSYRYSGHNAKDEGTSYRSKDEINLFQQRKDPIKNFMNRIVNKNLADEEELKLIHRAIKEEVQLTVKKVKGKNELPLTHLYEDVYKTLNYHL
ncbi:probable pyruvate dehydrogenase E1 component subunit alpha, mitochondrial [Saccostrea cucullata]|uniref:probable pyruvate dehydrogenase E1 component subunit alpha, mitochondrial n=1 Tax=Saccostrea cuccullata TaxID=36930 RepID=UPI002ED215C4